MFAGLMSAYVHAQLTVNSVPAPLIRIYYRIVSFSLLQCTCIGNDSVGVIDAAVHGDLVCMSVANPVRPGKWIFA